MKTSAGKIYLYYTMPSDGFLCFCWEKYRRFKLKRLHWVLPLPITRWKAYNGVVNFVFLDSYSRENRKGPLTCLKKHSTKHFWVTPSTSPSALTIGTALLMFMGLALLTSPLLFTRPFPSRKSLVTRQSRWEKPSWMGPLKLMAVSKTS